MKKRAASLAQEGAKSSTWRSQLTLKGKDRAFHQLRAGSVAAAHYKAAMAVNAEARKLWLQSEKAAHGEVEHTEHDLEAFIGSMHNSEGACASKVLALFKALQELTAHAKALAEQQIAHQEVLTSATADLHATDEAIADGKKVHAAKITECEADRADAAAKYVQYTNELEELAQIGNPDVRAQMAAAHVHARLTERGGLPNASYGAGAGGAEAGDYAAAAAAEDEEAPAAASLLETGSLKRKERKTASWSKRQCLAFLRFQVSSRQHVVRQPNATAGGNATAPEEETVPVVVDTCETDLASLQTKFQEAYTELTEMKELKLTQKDSTQCDELADSELDAEMVPLTTQREHASDKIEESEGAVAAMEPVIAMLRDQVDHMKEHVGDVKEECTDAQACEVHLGAVANLITSTINCPGVGELYLPTPKDVCHTNGLTCTWECSDHGSIFKTGAHYAHYETITNCPTGNEVEGRAFCERHCIKDVHCVGFTFHVDEGECLLTLDVLSGEFSQAPALHQEHTVYSCFVKERQALVDRFRDPAKPTVDKTNLGDHWCELNQCAHGEEDQFDTHGLDDECHEFCDHAGEALSEESHAEPEIADSPAHTDIDACGCVPSTGWCAEHGSCEAGKETSGEEAACCEQGKTTIQDPATETAVCVDSCGCPAGQGWCAEDGACEEGKGTSAAEEACCFVGMIPQKNGEETTCFDACGCPPGSGWCSDHKQCEASAHTDDNEAACCSDGKVPGHDAQSHQPTCAAVGAAAEEEVPSTAAAGNTTTLL